MSSVEEIERAIAELPREDFFRLRDWIEARVEDEWDQQIEQDLKEGKLEEIAKQAVLDHRTGQSAAFPPHEK